MKYSSRQWFRQGLTSLHLRTIITPEYLKVNKVFVEGQGKFMLKQIDNKIEKITKYVKNISILMYDKF
jgi:cellobiose-specific phosphotransferase system component IIB